MLERIQGPRLPGPRALRPRDLFDANAHGTLVTFSMRLDSVLDRATRAGAPWAILVGRWRGLRLPCLIAPTRWAATDHPSPGDAVVILGNLYVRDGDAVIWIVHLIKMSVV